MSWIRYTLGTADHPKILRLARLLRIDDAHALGIVVTIWDHAGSVRPGGDLGGMDATDIEALARWRGGEGSLYNALVSCRLIDETETGPRIHDGAEHAEAWARAAKETARRAEKAEKARDARVPHACPTRAPQNEDRGARVPVNDPADPAERTNERSQDSAPRREDPSSPPQTSTALVLAMQVEDAAVLRYDCDGPVSSWALTESQIARWSELYPSLDVESECRAALAWLEADPTRRKTSRGMARFLTGWLGRAQDRRPRNGGGGQEMSFRERDQAEMDRRVQEVRQIQEYEKRLLAGRAR